MSDARAWHRSPPPGPQRLIIGARIFRKGWYEKRCKECGARLLIMRTTGKWPGYRWFAYDHEPVDVEPIRYFRVHECTVRPTAPLQRTLL